MIVMAPPARRSLLLALGAIAMGCTVALILQLILHWDPSGAAQTPPLGATPATTRVTVPNAAAAAATTALPPLERSDMALRAALVGVFGQASVESYLVPNGIVRRVVATVDSLPRRHLAADSMPIKAPVAGFIATGDDQPTPLAAENFSKFTPYVRILAALDADKFGAVYRQFYPLLQQAYAALSHSDQPFNARALQAIDDMLAAPDITDPIMVVRRDALYEYADPIAENRSVGQKLMLRMGPDNAAAVKIALRRLRAVVAESR